MPLLTLVDMGKKSATLYLSFTKKKNKKKIQETVK